MACDRFFNPYLSGPAIGKIVKKLQTGISATAGFQLEHAFHGGLCATFSQFGCRVLSDEDVATQLTLRHVPRGEALGVDFLILFPIGEDSRRQVHYSAVAIQLKCGKKKSERVCVQKFLRTVDHIHTQLMPVDKLIWASVSTLSPAAKRLAIERRVVHVAHAIPACLFGNLVSYLCGGALPYNSDGEASMDPLHRANFIPAGSWKPPGNPAPDALAPTDSDACVDDPSEDDCVDDPSEDDCVDDLSGGDCVDDLSGGNCVDDESASSWSDFGDGLSDDPYATRCSEPSVGFYDDL